MAFTGLDKRIALFTLNKIGASTCPIYLGVINTVTDTEFVFFNITEFRVMN